LTRNILNLARIADRGVVRRMRKSYNVLCMSRHGVTRRPRH